ncbi:MAG TPA: SgcJ/EcaC family oxidoreductase [Pseudomonadales bacterium]
MAIDHEHASELAAAYTGAWNSGSSEAVAAFYAHDGQIVINRGSPWIGRKGVADMAAGFFADVPDLKLACDAVRCAGNHVAYFWTFTGTHASSKNSLRVVGWEEWDLDSDRMIVASRGWFDADDYARQTQSPLAVGGESGA